MLVGRDRELTALRAAMRASATDGRSMVIGGDAGSGKSTLLAAFHSDARRSGVAVIEGAGVEVESRRPFGAFADAIASCQRVFGPDRVERVLKERGLAVRQLVAPAAANAVGIGQDRYRIHGAMLDLFADLSEDGPLAILLEDLHWADGASLELFGYLARRLRGHPVLLVATYRTDELDRRHPLRPALAELRKARLLDELVLQPFDVETTGEMIRVRLGLRDPAPLDLREFRELIQARCDGNPLHIEETLDTLRRSDRLTYVDGAWAGDVNGVHDAIPANVADSVVARWARLSPAAQRIVLVASVVGHHFDLDVVAAVAQTTNTALAPLIHEAIDARLILEETDGQPLSFRHSLTREALRQQLLGSERVAVHAKIAAVLEHRHGTMPVRASELAYHFEESGDAARSSGYYATAAHEAAAMTDYASAARAMERAVATAGPGDTGEGDRQIELVGYLRLSGDDTRAARAASAALEVGERLGDVLLQAKALLELRMVEDRNSDKFVGKPYLERAVALLGPLGPTPELARAYSYLGGDAANAGDGVAALALAERTRDVAAALERPDLLASAKLGLGLSLWVQGRIEESATNLRQGIEMARAAGLVDELYAGLLSLSIVLGAIGVTSREQLDLRTEMGAVARENGFGAQGWIVRELHMLHTKADWDGFLKLLPRVPQPEHTDFEVCRLQALFTRIAREGPDGVSEIDAATMRVASGDGAPSATWLAEVLLLAGRASEAVALAATITDADVSRTYWGLIPASQTHSIGLFAARECKDESARKMFIASLLMERPIPVTPHYNRRHVALAKGDIAEREGRFDDAVAAYTEALAECERAQYIDNPVMFLMSLIQQRRAEAHLHATPPDVASAQADFDGLLPYWQRAKATWYLGQLRSWAEEHGLAFPQEAPTTATAPRDLTRREVEVARLVAQGLTNREIAARLTLSVRTAESHVEQIRSKLGFHTRAQVAVWAAERYRSPRAS